jgi:hypothetical protein
MKAKSFFSGFALFVVGMVVMLGIESNHRHHSSNHQLVVRKSTSIEVGAPLTVAQLKHEGFI